MMRQLLGEEFSGHLDRRLEWLHPPMHWSIRPDRGMLVVRPDERTDYWRRAHSGIEADNGHFLYMPVEGDFVLSTRVLFRPVHQYDQAGLMIRISPLCWLKASVEYELELPARLGVVVTNAGYSDWSTQDFPAGPGEVSLRIFRRSGDYTVEYAAPDGRWVQIRECHLIDDRYGDPVDCGLYACSPRGAGFEAEFDYLRIEALPPAPESLIRY